MTTHGEIWRVQLATGELRAMNLDALDEAFQSGLIHGGTHVLAPGAFAWAPLRDVAGLDSEDPPESAMTPSLSPVAISAEPIAIAIAAMHAPPAFDLGDLPDDDALRPKRGRALVAVGLALAALAGLGVFVGPKLGATLGDVHPASSPMNAPMNAIGVANAVEAPPAVDVTAPGTTSARELTEEQKQLLLEADRKRLEADKKKEEERKAKKPARSKGKKGRPRSKGTQPFVNGGDKYDPLNGAL